MKIIAFVFIGIPLLPFVLLGFVCHAIAGAFVQGACYWDAFVTWIQGYGS